MSCPSFVVKQPNAAFYFTFIISQPQTQTVSHTKTGLNVVKNNPNNLPHTHSLWYSVLVHSANEKTPDYKL